MPSSISDSSDNSQRQNNIIIRKKNQPIKYLSEQRDVFGDDFIENVSKKEKIQQFQLKSFGEKIENQHQEQQNQQQSRTEQNNQILQQKSENQHQGLQNQQQFFIQQNNHILQQKNESSKIVKKENDHKSQIVCSQQLNQPSYNEYSEQQSELKLKPILKFEDNLSDKNNFRHYVQRPAIQIQELKKHFTHEIQKLQTHKKIKIQQSEDYRIKLQNTMKILIQQKLSQFSNQFSKQLREIKYVQSSIHQKLITQQQIQRLNSRIQEFEAKVNILTNQNSLLRQENEKKDKIIKALLKINENDNIQ